MIIIIMAANDPPLSSTHPNCIFIAFADCVLKDLWETEQQHCIGKAQLPFVTGGLLSQFNQFQPPIN